MTVKVLSEHQILQEAVEILLEHLSPAKVARFLAVWQAGGGDYLSMRKQLFAAETVETLCEKIQTYQEGYEDSC